MMDLALSSMNSTRTCVTPPLEIIRDKGIYRDPVRPRILVTRASFGGDTFPVSIIQSEWVSVLVRLDLRRR